MPLSLDLDVIDAFRAIARDIANHLYNADFAPNYFRADALNAKLPAYRIDDTLICFCTGEHSIIEFSNIEPVDIISLEVGTPVKFNEHETDVTLDTYTNASDEPFSKKVKITESDAITQSKDILTEIASAIRAKVGGKTPVFEASLEAEISAKLGVNLKTQTEHKIIKEYEMDVKTPSWTQSNLSQRHSIADVRQRISMKCLVDASISFISDGEGGRWAKHFDSFREMENYLRGGGGGVSENADGLNNIVNTRQFQDYRVEKNLLELEIERERLSRNVRTGETEKKDTPIDNPNKPKRRRRKRKKES